HVPRRDHRAGRRPPLHDLRRRRSDRGDPRNRARHAPLAARARPARILMLAPAATLARATRALSRRGGKGGTTAPGRVLLRLEPDAIALLARRLELGSVLVSATNGKTTTASMLSAI